MTAAHGREVDQLEQADALAPALDDSISPIEGHAASGAALGVVQALNRRGYRIAPDGREVDPERVERLARAICDADFDADGCRWTWDEADWLVREDYRRLARVALAADTGEAPQEAAPEADPIADMRESSNDVAVEDVRAIAVALGLGGHARPYSAHDVVHREVLPAIADMREQIRRVAALADRERARELALLARSGVGGPRLREEAIAQALADERERARAPFWVLYGEASDMGTGTVRLSALRRALEGQL